MTNEVVHVVVDQLPETGSGWGRDCILVTFGALVAFLFTLVLRKMDSREKRKERQERDFVAGQRALTSIYMMENYARNLRESLEDRRHVSPRHLRAYVTPYVSLNWDAVPPLDIDSLSFAFEQGWDLLNVLITLQDRFNMLATIVREHQESKARFSEFLSDKFAPNQREKEAPYLRDNGPFHDKPDIAVPLIQKTDALFEAIEFKMPEGVQKAKEGLRQVMQHCFPDRTVLDWTCSGSPKCENSDASGEPCGGNETAGEAGGGSSP